MRAQQLSSKSFTERLSEAYSKIPSGQTTTGAPGIQSQTAAPARQFADTCGRNLAGTSSSSSPPPPAPAPPAPRSTADPATTIATASSPASADASVPAGWYIGPKTDPSTMPPAEAAVSGSETIDPIVEALLQQNAPPAPYAAVGAGSTDPAVFRTDGYIKALNLNSFLQAANHDNTYRYDRYTNALHEWSEHGMQGPPPAPPKYETVDLKGFDDWWSRYTPGYDEPSPTSFVANGPTDRGYGWTA